MRPLIVSYATRTPTFYAIAREKLIADCQRLNLEHSIRLIDPPGDWYGNVRHKPYFLRDCLAGKIWCDTDAPHARPIAWVDVDCRLNRVDPLPNLNLFDVGVHDATGNMDVTCGIIVLNRTARAMEFVQAWIDRMVQEGTPGEHGPLCRTVRNPPQGVRIINVTELFGWDVNEHIRDVAKRSGPIVCEHCGRGYDELLVGRQLVCRQCGTIIFVGQKNANDTDRN